MSAHKLGFLAPLAAAGIVMTAPVGPSPLAPGAAEAASFDCARASTPTERAICSDPQLSALDSRLQGAYDARVTRDQGVRELERGWLAARNAGCGKDVACLKRFTAAQIAWLESAALRPPSALPTRVGACALSSIKLVGSRLEGMPDSGSAVEETDGGYQVSYDVEAPIQASQAGDPALVCLVSIPSHCPPGDDRGRFYAVANLRTLGAWSDPDAEHMCGGA
jgi:uncharacterized protein